VCCQVWCGVHTEFLCVNQAEAALATSREEAEATIAHLRSELDELQAFSTQKVSWMGDTGAVQSSTERRSVHGVMA
jgi:hypothetical protein